MPHGRRAGCVVISLSSDRVRDEAGPRTAGQEVVDAYCWLQPSCRAQEGCEKDSSRVSRPEVALTDKRPFLMRALFSPFVVPSAGWSSGPRLGMPSVGEGDPERPRHVVVARDLPLA